MIIIVWSAGLPVLKGIVERIGKDKMVGLKAKFITIKKKEKYSPRKMYKRQKGSFASLSSKPVRACLLSLSSSSSSSSSYSLIHLSLHHTCIHTNINTYACI